MEIYYLMIFIWAIGWLITSGKYHQACKVTGDKKSIWFYISLMIIWPYYLGYYRI